MFGDVHVRVLTGIFALSAAAAVSFLPWRGLDKYHHYLGMRGDSRQVVSSETMTHGLVLIRGKEFPDYASPVTYSSLDFTGDAPVVARDRDPRTTAALLHAFADRRVWIVEGPTVTKAGYRVVAGPLAARDLLRTLNGSDRPQER
jgi:hypothetical protein